MSNNESMQTVLNHDEPYQVYVMPKISSTKKQQVTEAIEKLGWTVAFESDASKWTKKATIVFGDIPLSAVYAQEKLRWIQTASAGVDWLTMRENSIPEHIVLTNATGAYGAAGAEHVIGMMLYFTRNLATYVRNQRQHTWAPDVTASQLLYGKNLVIVGLGDIGGELAKRAVGFGMNVYGVKRTPGQHEFVQHVVTTEQLDDVLPLADHLAITLPLTPETKGLINRKRLALLPAGAYIYNIGRGPVIDEEALVAALQSRHIAGAGLDVFNTEPLPEDHPFWSMDNVFITPHVGVTPWDYDFVADMFLDNVQRLVAGKALRNRVQLQKGY